MKKGKRKVNIIGLLIILLFIYLVASFAYYILSMPIKNIYISGNTILSDAEIIDLADIKSYPSMIKVSKNKVSKKIKKSSFINDVKIKKKLNGEIYLTIDESKPLFVDRNTNKIVLLNGKNIDNIDNLVTVPFLINYVPNNIYKKLIAAFNKVDYNIILQISEIEYSPDIVNEKIIDEDRFYLRMIDGNGIYINPVNITRLNNYFDVYDRLPEGKKGILYFDSNSTNNLFKAFGASKVSEVDEGKLQS